jgi:hypothetical protein
MWRRLRSAPSPRSQAPPPSPATGCDSNLGTSTDRAVGGSWSLHGMDCLNGAHLSAGHCYDPALRFDILNSRCRRRIRRVTQASRHE